MVSIIWSVHIYKHITGYTLSSYGIYPRAMDGVLGIFTGPLVHSSWEHLLSNSVPLFVSTSLIHFFYKRVAWASLLFIYPLTGFLVWLFARQVYHIGASGVVYGLIAFIFGSGIFRRNIKSIILALVVTILYSGYIAGVLPYKEGVSWESHLLGAITGLLVSFFFKNILEADEIKTDPWANESTEGQYFFSRDIFDKTKEQRRLEAEADDVDYIG